jgi:hypothetical protein
MPFDVRLSYHRRRYIRPFVAGGKWRFSGSLPRIVTIASPNEPGHCSKHEDEAYKVEPHVCFQAREILYLAAGVSSADPCRRQPLALPTSFS